MQAWGMLLLQSAEPEPLMRYWLRYGSLETSAVTTQLTSICKLAGVKPVRWGEKRLSMKSRLLLGYISAETACRAWCDLNIKGLELTLCSHALSC